VRVVTTFIVSLEILALLGFENKCKDSRVCATLTDFD